MKGFLKFFVSLRSCKVKKLNANSLFLKVCHVTGYRDCRMHPKQTHFNINCTKTQLSVTMTLAKLFHNKSTQQYPVAHSYVVSS